MTHDRLRRFGKHLKLPRARVMLLVLALLIGGVTFWIALDASLGIPRSATVAIVAAISLSAPLVATQRLSRTLARSLREQRVQHKTIVKELSRVLYYAKELKPDRDSLTTAPRGTAKVAPSVHAAAPARSDASPSLTPPRAAPSTPKAAGGGHRVVRAGSGFGTGPMERGPHGGTSLYAYSNRSPLSNDRTPVHPRCRRRDDRGRFHFQQFQIRVRR